MIDITKLTDAELRQLVEDGLEIMAPIERMVAQATEGTFACPRCGETASWARGGQHWSAHCEGCEWNAAGMGSAAAVAS